MKPEFQIIIIIFIHWVADFLLQTREMALNKSKSNYWLSIHCLTYSAVWLFTGVVLWGFNLIELYSVILFTAITFVCHFITDYFTSRWTSKLYATQKFYGFPSFFSVIGLDQFLHYAQLILCFYFIIK